MKVNVTADGLAVTYCITTLCNHGEEGDYQATPSQDLGLDLLKFGQRLRDAGIARVGFHASRIFVEWRGTVTTVFGNGRIVLEHVKPDRQSQAAELVAGLMAASGARIGLISHSPSGSSS